MRNGQQVAQKFYSLIFLFLEVPKPIKKNLLGSET